jgi:xanthine dehydrogenase accessory factor
VTLSRRDLARFEAASGAVVRIRVERVRGSAPREAGAVMLVDRGAEYGTIGGGQLEYMALDEARALLARGERHKRLDVPLGPEIGQCCGGRVEIALDLLDAAARAAELERLRAAARADPHVLVMGAGHVGRALADALALLPVRVLLVDSRAEELARYRGSAETLLTPLPEAEVRAAPPGSAFVVLTHDHSLDFLITAEALARGDAAYVGMIGSRTKRVSFHRFAAEAGTPPEATARLICPIGAQGSADKRPEVIAAFVAAEVMARLTARQPAPQAAPH